VARVSGRADLKSLAAQVVKQESESVIVHADPTILPTRSAFAMIE
jgi:hypothetical protein